MQQRAQPVQQAVFVWGERPIRRWVQLHRGQELSPRPITCYRSLQIYSTKNYTLYLTISIRHSLRVNIIMWRTVGTVNPHQPKHNKSRDQGNNIQPFAQASRLKLNESHLSGDNHQRFMGEYFGRKRASQGTLQRVLSHKQIEPRPFVSPPTSLREVNSPRIHPLDNSSLKNMDSIHNLVDSIEGHSLEEANLILPPPKATSIVSKSQLQSVKGDLKTVKSEQAALRKSVKDDLFCFQKEMQDFQGEVRVRFEALQADREKERKEGVNPELLARIRQQSARFNQRMREMDGRKEQVRERYRTRLQNV